MNDNSIVVINNNEDYAHILYEKIENGKKTVMVNGEYIHPEDYEKVIKFFDLKKLDRGFLNGKEKKSLKFRRIIDWTYQWVNVTATKLYNLGRDLILFSFENINEEIEKDNCINELIKFFKHEYLLSVCVHLDTMSYFAEWKDEGIHSLPDNGYYDTLYNLILTDNYESISSEFKEMFKPNKLVDNFDEKLPKIKKEINLRNKGKIKKYNIELFYRFVDEKKVAYILVKEIEL